MIRVIPRLETYPRLVRLAQHPAGKLGGLAAFAIGLRILGGDWWRDVSVMLLILTAFPAQRRRLLTLASLGWLAFHPGSGKQSGVLIPARVEGIPEGRNLEIVVAGCLFAGFLLAALYAWYWLRRPVAAGQRPVFALITLYIFSIVIVGALPLSGMSYVLAWGVTVSFGGYLWYLGYTLIDRHNRDRDPLSLQIGAWWPFWLGGAGPLVPFPNGPAALRRVEAKTPEELAVTQLKGLKLLAWVVLLSLGLELFVEVVNGVPGGSLPRMLRRIQLLTGLTPPLHLGVPTYDVAFARSALGHPYPWWANWTALIGAFFQDLLFMSVWGGTIVATCRMAGFRILRNTYRPLQSRSIADFWNRYFFYFKELMVDFFFFPTFAR